MSARSRLVIRNGDSQIKLPKPLKSARQTKEQEKERAEKRKKAEATAARTELIGAILKGRNRAGFVLPLLVRQTVRLAQSEVLKKAVSLLGLEAIRSRGYVDAEGTLKHALSRASESEVIRIGLALALAAGEQSITNGWPRADLSIHFDLLASHGYELTSFEKQELKESGLEDAEDLAPACRICGCTEDRACRGGCYWIEDPEQKGDLCSACLPKIQPSMIQT